MIFSRNLYRCVGIATAIGVSAAGIYYLYWRRTNRDKMSRTVKELKDLGNELFAAKNYGESIRMFSEAINAWDTGDDDLLVAMCFQNRAAAKEHDGGYSVDDMLSDCEEALKYNPRYAKAYLRKARLLNMRKEYMTALTCVFCATQLDPELETQTGNILAALLDKLEELSYESWLHDSSARGLEKHVRHEKVYTWLRKTVVSDCIRRDVISSEVSGNSPYGVAILKVRNKDYDNVADVAIQEDGENSMKSLILAGRFYLYQNRLDLLSTCLKKFDFLINAPSEIGKAEKKDLLSAKHVLCIEAGRTFEEVKKAFTNAINFDKTNGDFYVMAAFRYVLFNEPHAALEILSTEGISTDNIKLLQLTLEISNSANPCENTIDLSMLHTKMVQLENFVSGIEPKTGYALSLLAKITSTFCCEASGRFVSDDVIALEPTESIHYFDRSCMAASCKEAMDYLLRCLEIEPYHAEANLMFASLLMNEIGERALTRDEYEKLEMHISKAMSTFDDNVDFPVIMGVFRLCQVLIAKKNASSILGS